MWKRVSALVLGAAAVALATCTSRAGERDLGLLTLPLRAESLDSLDPVHGEFTYENQACSMVYDTLLQYRYLGPWDQLEPALLEAMPETSDLRTYRFRLKRGVRFHDDPCFPSGVGRELVSADVFYSWKRLADEANRSNSWSIFENTIVGFDAYRAQQNRAATFDYDAPVEGLRIVDDHTFEVVLNEPVYAFLFTLAMFQTAVVPREAVENYGDRFARHPVGTGAFRLDSWDDLGLTFVSNPTYREERFPTSWLPGDEEFGVEESAGELLPLVERVRYVFYPKDGPMWERFRDGTLGLTHVPTDFFTQAYDRGTKLAHDLAERGVMSHSVPQHNVMFRMFDMQDAVVGGDSERARNLRRAISLAIDLDEINASCYLGQCVAFDGMIPPDLHGHPEGEDRRAGTEYRGLDTDRAATFLAEAGYPGGKGLEPIHFYFSSRGNDQELAEVIERQLAAIGVRLVLHPLPFEDLMEAIHNRKAQFFSISYNLDFPDPLSFLALFYGPNASPGINYSNYSNPEYDRLYVQVRALPPSTERTKLIVKMRDMVLEDGVITGSLMRTRNWVVQPWLSNAKPTELFFNWVKYLKVDVDLRGSRP